MKKIKNNRIIEKPIETLFLISAIFSVLSLGVITVYIFINGTPAIFKIGILDFLTGSDWSPKTNTFGIATMIVGSLTLTAGATIAGIFISVFTAIFLAELAPKALKKVIRPAINLLAGIPSVVYGFFGLIVIVPIIRKLIGGPGQSLLSGIIVLTIMILPTIISITETSLDAVPKEYKEGSLALGASKMETIFKVQLPAAKNGVMAGIVLGIGRAIGETMAVILVTGNRAMFPTSLADPIRTLTANIAQEMSYASGFHRDALFATGVILFIFIMLLNIALNLLINRKVGKAR